jgi:very-short-patch-repair endonuclease
MSKISSYAINLKLRERFNKLNHIVDKWGYLRQLYMENISDILKVSEENIHRWSDVYYLDWPSFFSPIEKIAWNSIRDLGFVVLYPQFPLFNYFIDFANPYLRIGLELDGKCHDKIKDRERDIFLHEYGWEIFRITGRESFLSYKNISEIEEDGIIGLQKKEQIEHWFLNTFDGVLNAIRYTYFFNWIFR